MASEALIKELIAFITEILALRWTVGNELEFCGCKSDADRPLNEATLHLGCVRSPAGFEILLSNSHNRLASPMVMIDVQVNLRTLRLRAAKVFLLLVTARMMHSRTHLLPFLIFM